QPPTSTLFPYTTLFRSTLSRPVFIGSIGCHEVVCGYRVNRLPGSEVGSVRKDHLVIEHQHLVFVTFNVAHDYRAGVALSGQPSKDRKSTRLNSSHVKIS